jgi:methionyl-tRNA synthetase
MELITTTLPYANGAPHLGHAFELTLADFLVRLQRAKTMKELFFNAGLDEHGLKMERSSISKGYTNPQEYCDAQAADWNTFLTCMEISPDRFYRTTDSKHKSDVQEIFQKLVDKGDIYKGQYKGTYCEGCESFVESTGCDIHPDKKLELVEEENYFFKLTKYASILEGKLLKEQFYPQHYYEEYINK